MFFFQEGFYYLSLFLINILKNKFTISLDSILSIISILTNILVPVLITYYLQNKFLINRNLKAYHMTLCDNVLTDYKVFLDDLIKGKICYNDVAHTFKVFSIKFTHIDNENTNRFETSIKLQRINREIQTIITQSKEYNNFKIEKEENDKFILKPKTTNLITFKYSELLSKNGILIEKINK